MKKPKKLSPMLSALGAIRTELGAKLDKLTERVDGLADRVTSVETAVVELHRHQREVEIRISTEMAAVVGAIHEVRDAVLGTRGLTAQVHNHESRIGALERRVR